MVWLCGYQINKYPFRSSPMTYRYPAVFLYGFWFWLFLPDFYSSLFSLTFFTSLASFKGKGQKIMITRELFRKRNLWARRVKTRWYRPTPTTVWSSPGQTHPPAVNKDSARTAIRGLARWATAIQMEVLCTILGRGTLTCCLGTKHSD